jgi:zinc protease
VLNERRQNYENRPYGLATVAISRALFPDGHPYQWLTIGETDDIRAATLEDVQAFFARYYHPANASLALAGDVGLDEGFALAERYFGDIPPGPALGTVTAPQVVVDGDCRLLLEDRVEFPRLFLTWPSPALFAPGDAELDLASEVIAGGKTSRLYRSLVVERRLALDVMTYQTSRELGGVFEVVSTAAPGISLSQLDDAISAELARLAREGPDDAEVTRARAQAEAQFVFRLQTVGGFSGKSDQLNAYNIYRGDPGFAEADFARYERASADAIRQAVAEYLPAARRVALSVVPRGRAELALTGSRIAEAS